MERARGTTAGLLVILVLALLLAGSAPGATGVSVTVPYYATAVVDSALDDDPGTGSWTDAGNLNLTDGTKSVSRVVIL